MKKEKYGFVYIWYDRKHKRYYIGCHWGTEDDGYICSSRWMRKSYKRRPQDFKRRILKNNIYPRSQMYIEEQRYLNMIKISEIKPLNQIPRYYNLHTSSKDMWHQYTDKVKSIGQKISASKKGKSTGPCSPEKAAKISASNKGRKFSQEHIQNLSKSHKGYKYTDNERKKKQSERLKQLWADPIWAENQRKKIKQRHKLNQIQ